MMPPEAHPPTRLARRLGMVDAVVIGLGSMIGAGVFAAFAPAARAAGNGLVIGLLVAAIVAYANAASSAQLATLYPRSGGTYVYGRERLGHFWGFMAGWAFVFGKLASCAAMAMTFASHAVPVFHRPVACGAVLMLTAVNYCGVQKTLLLTRIVVVAVLIVLLTVIAVVWSAGAPDATRLWPLPPVSAYGVLQSAGFLFFAFAGYARLATLGEEVADPRRTIPRAIPVALGIALMVYAAVAVTLLAGLGAADVAATSAPLAAAVQATRLAWMTPLVRIGAALASLGALLSLIAGISRTIFAMASNADLPSYFAAVHPRFRVPHRAELLAGCIVAFIAACSDIRGAIGFSSVTVLTYYAIANAAAWTLSAEERQWPRPLALLGFGGCAAISAALPLRSVLLGASVLILGAVIYVSRRLAR